MSSIALGDSALFNCTITFTLHLHLITTTIKDIWHWSVFKATLIHPLEAHSTGLSFDGIANHLNIVNVAVCHSAGKRVLPSLSLYWALSIGLKGTSASSVLHPRPRFFTYLFPQESVNRCSYSRRCCSSCPAIPKSSLFGP